VKRTEYAWGRSKVFVRNPRALFDLEDRRRAATIRLAIKIQAVYRGWRRRSQFKAMRKAQITIASNFRGFVHRNKFTKMRAAQILVASYVRMWLARKVLPHFRACLPRVLTPLAYPAFLPRLPTLRSYPACLPRLLAPRSCRFCCVMPPRVTHHSASGHTSATRPWPRPPSSSPRTSAAGSCASATASTSGSSALSPLTAASTQGPCCCAICWCSRRRPGCGAFTADTLPHFHLFSLLDCIHFHLFSLLDCIHFHTIHPC
jgi:hypothetical protein